MATAASALTTSKRPQYRRTIFGYTPKKTVFSTFHPLARLAVIILFNVPFLVVNIYVNMAFLALALLLYSIARIPQSYVKKFIPFVCTLTFFLFLSFAFFPSMWIQPPYKYVLFKIGGFTYFYESFIVSLTMWTRWMAAIFGVLFVFSLVDERDINIALEKLRFPYFLRLTIATGLRCFFTFYYDALQVIEAQKARGLDLDNMGALKKVRYYAAVIVPLIMIELKKADEMADAADSRGYVATFKKGDYIRSEYLAHFNPIRIHDQILIACALIALVGTIVMLNIPLTHDVLKWIPADPHYWAGVFH